MVRWSIVFLPEVDADLAALATRDAGLPVRIQNEIVSTFTDPFKAARFAAAAEGHARTNQVDRLAESGFPQSFRLQVHNDFRATVWCLRPARQAVIVHIFAKSADPTYRRAVPTHDARLRGYFLPFREFVETAERSRR